MSEEELDRLLDEADDPKLTKRLTFVKRLYKGANLEDAADDVGKSASTCSRWARRWNEGDLGLLTPNFGAGRSPKLAKSNKNSCLRCFVRINRGKHKKSSTFWTKNSTFSTILIICIAFYEILAYRTQNPVQSGLPDQRIPKRFSTNASYDAFDEDEQTLHNKRPDDDEEGWVLDDDVCTDGGTVVGFCDASHPQPYDNAHRLWFVDELVQDRPLVTLDEPAVGCYTLNGESILTFPEDQSKENICALFERVREQNPGTRILLVLDNFSSHVCEFTRKRAHQLGITLVFLPVGSPHLNPIEQVWKTLKRAASPIIVASETSFRTLARRLFDKFTEKIGFAKPWIDKFLGPYFKSYLDH